MNIEYQKYPLKMLILLLGLYACSGSTWAQVKQATRYTDSSSPIKQVVPQMEPSALFEVNKSGSTAAVSTVSGAILYKTPSANLSNTLYGVLPGLTVSQGSGEPGYDAASLFIRGTGSYNNIGDYTIYVNGFQTNFNYLQYLSPSEIESFSIFKDAAALATFGMKGANGVVWITTKRGEAGKSKIQLQVRTAYKSPININKPLKSYDYANLYNEAVSNDNNRVWSPAYSPAQLAAYKNGTGVNTSWYDEVLKSSTPFTTADASFSGGTDIARYFVMMGYMNDQGLYNVKNDDTHSNAGQQIFNLRTSLDFKMYNIFEGKIDLGGRIEDRKYPNFLGSSLWNNLAAYPSNIYAPKNNDGSWAGTSVYPNNPLASINELGTTSTHDRTIQANFTLKEKLDFITKGLYLSEAASYSSWSRGSYNVTKNYARVIDSVLQTTDQNTTYAINDDHGTNQWNWGQFQAQLGYNKTVGLHDLSAAVNYQQSVYNVDANLNGAAGVNMKYASQNIAGKIHYEYNKRYTAEFGFAYSGSDNYAKGNRFGFYPSISAAWNLSNESFLAGNKNIDLLKLRASAGKSGYDRFTPGRYLYQQYYAYSGSYPTGNGTPVWGGGIIQSNVPTPDIFAEQSMKYNIGAEARLFKIIDITVDAFINKQSNIVTRDNSLLATFGTESPYRNIGKVTNKGLEASLNFTNHAGRLNYQFGGSISYNDNKIDYMAEIPPATPSAAQTGRRIGTPFGYDANGFYDMTDFNSTGSLNAGIAVPSFGNVQPGDIKYKDQNGDNKIDQRDVVPIGNTYLPKITYTISAVADMANFDLRILFQGVSGRSVNLLDAKNQTIAFQNNGNAYAIAQGRWAYYPNEGIDTRATATYPRLSKLDNANNYSNSTFWMKNGSFLRLRNVELGYSLPKSVLRKTKLSNGRIFISGINLFTWSALLKNNHIDPETMTGYAGMKSMNMGFTVNF